MATNTEMTKLDTLMKYRHRMKHHSKLAITGDDTKVLGRITEMRTEKVRESGKFSTNKMKTHNSAWTPVVNKASNEQVDFLYNKCHYLARKVDYIAFKVM